MATLPNLGIIQPTLGGDSGSWDDKLNAALVLIDDHDHTSGKGVQIVTAAIDIDDDLSFGGHGATALGLAAFTAVTALAAGTKTLFVSSADNELYWRSNAGTNVKLTSGSTLNISLVGGIAGDYTSVGAEVTYDDANDRYTFKQQGSKPWARIAAGPIRIYEFNTLETVYIELAVAAALASSYTITLPAALPAATSLLTITAAGIVATDGVLGTDKTITLSGTGRVLHGSHYHTLPITYPDGIFSGTPTVSTSAPGLILDASSTNYIPIRGIPYGGRLVGVTLYSDDSANSTAYSLVTDVIAGGIHTAAFSANIAGSPTTTAAETVIVAPTTPITQVDGSPLWVKIVVAAGSTRTFISMAVTCDVV